jgi:E3 ubiquitin-protein ligase DOA10
MNSTFSDSLRVVSWLTCNGILNANFLFDIKGYIIYELPVTFPHICVMFKSLSNNICLLKHLSFLCGANIQNRMLVFKTDSKTLSQMSGLKILPSNKLSRLILPTFWQRMLSCLLFWIHSPSFSTCLVLSQGRLKCMLFIKRNFSLASSGSGQWGSPKGD